MVHKKQIHVAELNWQGDHDGYVWDFCMVFKEQGDDARTTRFIGFDPANFTGSSATCEGIVRDGENAFLLFDQTPFYAEMGGQVGDSGTIEMGGQTFTVGDVTKDASGRHLHALAGDLPADDPAGEAAILNVDVGRRLCIHRHHTATHVLHWALREVLGDHVSQAGSLV